MWLVLVELSGNSPLLVHYTTVGSCLTIFMIVFTMGVVTIPIALISNTLPDLYPTEDAAVGPEAVRQMTPPSHRRRINPRKAAKEDLEWEE